MLARQVFQSGFSYSPHSYETLTSSIEHYLRIRSQDHIVACEHVFVVELLNLASGAHGDVNQMWFNDGTTSLVDCVKQGQRPLQGTESPWALNCARDQYRTRQIAHKFYVCLDVCGYAFQLTANHVLNLIECHPTDKLPPDIGQRKHAMSVNSRFQLGTTACERGKQSGAFRSSIGN
ncbi:hypothetical protein BIW19_00480 [Pseudomonas putida]|nr:hypothetical protein BIW19_00480 [Pseudomonas putida]